MTKLEFRMTITDTDIDYLTSHFIKFTVIYHNVLKDMSTACGMRLVCQGKDLKPTGEPRCKRCVRAIDAVFTP